MTQPHQPSDDAAAQVKSVLTGQTGTTRHLTGANVRLAARVAARGTRTVGRSASHLAREAIEGTVRAVGEVGGETTGFVRDAVIGVIEGTEQVVAVTAPAVKEVVAGAIRGSSMVTEEVATVSQNAVEGAIVGAASVGMDAAEAATAAVDAAVEAVVDAGGDLRDAATASITGVISGVAATGGDVAAAVRDSAGKLVDHAVIAEQPAEDVATVAGDVLDAVLSEAERASSDPAEVAEVVSAAASAAVTAAYEAGRSHGDMVREEVVRTVSRRRRSMHPELQRHFAEVAERLAEELPRGRAAWRGTAAVRAVRILLDVGANDLAASLAYFTVLSFFPLVALGIIGISFFAGADTVRAFLDDLVAHYFPASTALFHEAVDGLIENSAAFGIVALGGLAFAANGLFMAANRSVNRVFGVANRRTLRARLADYAITFFLGIILLLSIGMSVFVQTSIGFAGDQPQFSDEGSRATYILLGAISAILPAGVTGLVFAFVYHHLPRVQVEWRDAAFGGMVALILFEGGKHLFIWLSGMAADRFVVYGPVASTVVVLMWAYVAGLIFLYGAGLARAAGELRPRHRYEVQAEVSSGEHGDR